MANPEVNPEFNPFGPLDMKDVTLEDALQMSVGDYLKCYRKRALQMHPDKFPEDQRKEATENFQRLEMARRCLCKDKKISDRYAGTWLFTEREQRIRLQEIEQGKQAREKRAQQLKQEPSPKNTREEAMLGVVVLQGHLSSALRSNQRMERKKDNISQESRLVARSSADQLQARRCTVFQKPGNMLTEGTEAELKAQKAAVEDVLVKKASRTRTNKKLLRALAKVDAERAKAKAQGKPYKGPSEAAWKRTAHGWFRQGVFVEGMKKKLAARRVKREQELQAQLAADPERADREEYEDQGRNAYRKYNRRQQENPREGMTMTKPPTRAKDSSTRKTKRTKNARKNKKTRGIREACLQQLASASASNRLLPLVADDSVVVPWDISFGPAKVDEQYLQSKSHRPPLP